MIITRIRLPLFSHSTRELYCTSTSTSNSNSTVGVYKHMFPHSSTLPLFLLQITPSALQGSVVWGQLWGSCFSQWGLLHSRSVFSDCGGFGVFVLTPGNGGLHLLPEQVLEEQQGTSCGSWVFLFVRQSTQKQRNVHHIKPVAPCLSIGRGIAVRPFLKTVSHDSATKTINPWKEMLLNLSCTKGFASK